MESKLRDYLISALGKHPGKRRFHLYVLVSEPRKTNKLYPYARGKVPKVWMQDVLVLLCEESEGERVMVCGIEAAVYDIRETSSGILHVSKVDSTGQAKKPSPTSVLVKGFIKYYVDGETRPVEVENMWVQLFARAQEEYLFLGSKGYEEKKTLGDVRLCGWWRSCLGEVGGEMENARMYWLLAGYSEKEAIEMVGVDSGGKWEYGHPYGQKEVRLPCDGDSELGRAIPCFEDDPKSRFMDEIGQEERPRKRAKLEGNTIDQFWERMEFRQECVAGAVTGFFTLIVTCSSRPAKGGQQHAISEKINQRILRLLETRVDFSTREKAQKETEVVEKAIRGLCDECYGTVETTELPKKSVVVEEGRHVTKLVPRRRRK